jgi:hypothetical protein
MVRATFSRGDQHVAMPTHVQDNREAGKCRQTSRLNYNSNPRAWHWRHSLYVRHFIFFPCEIDRMKKKYLLLRSTCSGVHDRSWKMWKSKRRNISLYVYISIFQRKRSPHLEWPMEENIRLEAFFFPQSILFKSRCKLKWALCLHGNEQTRIPISVLTVS